MKNKQLTLAREYRGYTQTELASAVKGLSQSNLSKFEKGIDILSENIQQDIIKFLNFPQGFFEQSIPDITTNSNYRKRSTIPKTEVRKFEIEYILIGYIIDELCGSIEWPEYTLGAFNLEDGYDGKDVAKYTRIKLGLKPDLPVKNICNLLEKNGIIIYEIDAPEKIDGISFFTEMGTPMIIVNKGYSNDRKRFTIAHELGHIIMHNDNNFPISNLRDKEAEANEFAGEFLMPEKEIKKSLLGLRFSDLASIKSYWLTSMSSIIRRAKDLGCIDSNRYKFFMIEMSRSHYTKVEPINVFIDAPSSFKNAINALKENLNYSKEDFSNYMFLPEDLIEDLILPRDTFKLRII